METTQRYIPALGLHWLTPLYDPFIHRLMREDELRWRLVLEADILPGMRVLDLGCGTGTLTILTKQSHLFAKVYGLDADPQALGIARHKADQAKVDITLEQGLAYQLPYPQAWFDRLITSLVFHHLTAQHKQQAFIEAFRVLRPGGKLIMLDISAPRGAYARLISQVIRRTERADDNVRGLLPGMIKQAGFINGVEIDHFGSLFGTLAIYRAEKPMLA